MLAETQNAFVEDRKQYGGTVRSGYLLHIFQWPINSFFGRREDNSRGAFQMGEGVVGEPFYLKIHMTDHQ